MGPFDDARSIFLKFQEKIEPEAVAEIEEVLEKFHASYDTAIGENRFLVGGVVEYVLCAAFNSIDDFVATHLKVARYDMQVHDRKTGKRVRYSAKSNFVKGGTINLINVRDEDPEAKWREATIFALSEIGIVYADPAFRLHPWRAPDAVQIAVEEIIRHAQRNRKFVVPAKIPHKMKSDPSRQKTASEDVARSLLKDCRKLRLDKV